MTVQASSPFLQPSGNSLMGLGVSNTQVYDVTVLAASGNIVITLPQICTKGRLRIKSSGVNAATTIAIGAITGTDGTNTVQFGGVGFAATPAGVNFELLKELLTDLQLTSITIPVTLAGATTAATISTEFYGIP